MDVYGVVIAITTAVSTCVGAIVSWLVPNNAPLIISITGAVATCVNSICEILRKWNQKKAEKSLE